MIEHFGLQAYGGRTTDNDGMLLDAVEAKPYLAARVLIDVARRKGL